MIEITDKTKCSGCGACLNICPKNSITLQDDTDGFWYPSVDKFTCVNCHKCEQICPFYKDEFIHREKKYKSDYYSGQLKDRDELSEVSSGGAAWGLARAVIEKGGVVYGAAQYNVDTIRHIRAESINEAKKIRRSKYLQSDTGTMFRLIKKDLENDRLVLFTGVGCQVAGLKSFLGKEYNNLITADVICHGVPSGKAWKAYRNYVEEMQHSVIKDLVFRDKSAGWKTNQYKLTFEDGCSYKEKSVDNPFHRGYLMGLYSRPSCGACMFDLLPRVSDLTFADYWKYDGNMFQETKSLGVSLICINTDKGKNNILLLEKYVNLESTTEEKALNSARHLNNKPLENENRNQFLKELTSDNFYYVWNKYIKEPPLSLIVKIKMMLKRCFLILGKVKGLFK